MSDLSPPNFSTTESSISHKRHVYPQAEEDKNICASKITQQKIGRYFGQVKYSQSDVQLPKDEDYTVIIDVMLETMRKQLQDEEIDLSLPASYEELKNINIANTPKIFKDGIYDIRKVYTDIMRKLAYSTSQEAETRYDWFRRLKNIVCEVMHQHMLSPVSLPYQDRMFHMLDCLISLCDTELDAKGNGSNQSHVIWTNFWRSLFTYLGSSYMIGEDEQITAGSYVASGACEEIIVVTTPTQNEDDAPKSINITVKPEFLLCTKRDVLEKNEKTSQRRIAIVGEITTTNFDGTMSPQGDSENSSNKIQTAVKKQKISHTGDFAQDTMGPPLSVPSALPVDVETDEVKILDGLGKMRTKHFTDLLCMMRASLISTKYDECRNHMFGWYSVMNKVYLTCLVAKTAKKSFYVAFVTQHLAQDYLDQNDQPSPNLFKQFCFPPLNVFLPGHFEALFELLNYLIWQR